MIHKSSGSAYRPFEEQCNANDCVLITHRVISILCQVSVAKVHSPIYMLCSKAYSGMSQVITSVKKGIASTAGRRSHCSQGRVLKGITFVV